MIRPTAVRRFRGLGAASVGLLAAACMLAPRSGGEAAAGAPGALLDLARQQLFRLGYTLTENSDLGSQLGGVLTGERLAEPRGLPADVEVDVLTVRVWTSEEGTRFLVDGNTYVETSGGGRRPRIASDEVHADAQRVRRALRGLESRLAP